MEVRAQGCDMLRIIAERTGKVLHSRGINQFRGGLRPPSVPSSLCLLLRAKG